MSDVVLNVFLILLFILIGGVFAASEMALVSLRESQLADLDRRGGRGSVVARLARDSNRFLSAVQVGVTLAGFFSASYGAATITPALTPMLESWGLSSGTAYTVAFITITLVISYLSLVLGELVPKRLALQRSEALAMLVAVPLDRLASLLKPVIWLLSASTNIVVRILGGDPQTSREEISEEELRLLLSQHEGLTTEERGIVTEVLDVGERAVDEVMLPRTEIASLPQSMTVAEAVQEVKDGHFSRYPVTGESIDDILGFVHVRDLFDPDLVGQPTLVGDLAREMPVFPASVKVLSAMTRMRKAGAHLALVVDEYGGTAGIVSLEDIIEEFVGEIHDEYDEVHAPADLPPGVIELDGLLNTDEVPEQVPGLDLPEGDYDTLGGWFMATLGRVPKVGDTLPVGRFDLRVFEMDGRRVARVAVREREPATDVTDDDHNSNDTPPHETPETS
ncbi:hemolysin family protein [Kribbia dieselivorans]|uniref:hemolysin family protein n=1 Tax=Kribbia dieselivorans TaxID=331526 RepID=UPI0009FB54A2|nr:hemolysin family protein [Kribbia dieselivorans]